MFLSESKRKSWYVIMSRRAVSDFIEIISTIDFGKSTLVWRRTMMKRKEILELFKVILPLREKISQVLI